MIRIGAFCYRDLPEEGVLVARMGERAAAHLAQDRRGNARRETLLGFYLLSQLLPGADLFAVTRTAEGRPFLAGRPDLDFSISHCTRLVVCAVESGEAPRVGIDVEPLGEQNPAAMRRIAARWFSGPERERWNADPTEETFLALWTAKEAAAKWQGGGLRDLRAVAPAKLTTASYRVGNAAVTAVCAPGRLLPKEITVFDALC